MDVLFSLTFGIWVEIIMVHAVLLVVSLSWDDDDEARLLDCAAVD